MTAVARQARSHPRRFGFALLALFVAVTASLVWMLPSSQATSGGDAYATPDVVDTNPSPTIVETTLTADETTVDIGGVTAHAETFNGAIPGPTFHLNVGDTVIVHLVNNLSSPTAIHWHGIELPNEMDGTAFTQNAAPAGGTFLYKFTVTRPGIYWYHPHHHSSTNQVFHGLYGMIVVKDPNEDALIANGTLPSTANTRQIVLSDTTVCKTSGSNDAHTYDDNAVAPAGSAPWSGGAQGTLPPQPSSGGPAPAPNQPVTLCQAPTAIDENGSTAGVPSFVAGDIPNIQRAGDGQVNEGQTVLTNGKNVGDRPGTTQAAPPGSAISPGVSLAPGASMLNVQPGQGLRLQIVNAATIRYMRLRLTTAAGGIVPLIRVGGEGGLLDAAVQEPEPSVPASAFDSQYTSGEILLPPGSRADVVAAIPAAPTTGVLTMWTEDYQRIGSGAGYANTPTVPVMHLNLTGAVVNPAFAIADGKALRAATGNLVEQLPLTLTPLQNPGGFNPVKTGMQASNINLQGGQIDGFKAPHDVPDYATAGHFASSRYARIGDTLVLSATNTTAARHPFHLHGFSIQPIDLTKAANPTYTWAYHEFRDNVDIPPGYKLRFTVRIDDRPKVDGTTSGGALGRWLFHCHIFFHATLGMLSELVVLPASADPANGKERPDINTNANQVTVSQGATASITGTYSDSDGQAVTLSSSAGSMTDNGGGAYTWSFPTGSANSQFVYLTATDAGGLKSQMPVKLTITNTAPALTLPAAQSVAQGGTLSFNISGNDADAVDPLALTASGLPAGLTFKDNGDRTGSVSGQVTDPPGPYSAGFSVSDGKNNPVTGNLAITVTQPVFSALVSKIEKLSNKKITVGCKFVLPSVTSCAALAKRGTKQVGKATATSPGAKSALNVGVTLSKSTRKAVAHSVFGVPVNVALTSLRQGNTNVFTGAKNTRVVPGRIRVVTAFGAFTSHSSKLTKHAKSYLKSLGKKLGSVKHIVCTAHPDRGSANKALALARAKAGCAVLSKSGLKSTFTSVGSSKTHNRRLEITILR